MFQLGLGDKSARFAISLRLDMPGLLDRIDPFRYCRKGILNLVDFESLPKLRRTN